MRYLLDVNALLAAIWRNHPDFGKTDAWIQARALATCPLSELGFLRVSTHPKALKADMATARQLLKAFIEKNRVKFVAASLPALKSKPTRSEEVTDFYLAELAAKNQMKLATLDRNIRHPAVEIIGPSPPEVPMQ
jgi:uncharacterized protein